MSCWRVHPRADGPSGSCATIFTAAAISRALRVPANTAPARGRHQLSPRHGRSVPGSAGRGSDLHLTLQELAGDDPGMIRNVRNAQRVADCAVSVLIRGPTGCGKEAFARGIHLASNRGKRPFVAVNCGAIPETLIESELFGYTAGAFTGARREGMRGRIAQSSGGTLFLDEIGDMPLPLQTRLLRILEDQEVTPLGSEAGTKSRSAGHLRISPESARAAHAGHVPRRPVLPPEWHYARAARARGAAR